MNLTEMPSIIPTRQLSRRSGRGIASLSIGVQYYRRMKNDCVQYEAGLRWSTYKVFGEVSLENQEGHPLQDVPTIYASGVSLAATGTDIKLIFTDHPASLGADGQIQNENRALARGVVVMSFHTAKDLCSLLGNAMSSLEKLLGPIDTPYLQRERKNEAK